MRVFSAAAVLVVSALILYASTGTSAQDVVGQVGFTSGETVVIYFDPIRSGKSCTVTEVRGDFVGCRTDTDSIGQQNYDHWYNLRMIARIDRPAKLR